MVLEMYFKIQSIEKNSSKQEIAWVRKMLTKLVLSDKLFNSLEVQNSFGLSLTCSIRKSQEKNFFSSFTFLIEKLDNSNFLLKTLFFPFLSYYMTLLCTWVYFKYKKTSDGYICSVEENNKEDINRSNQQQLYISLLNYVYINNSFWFS